MGKKLVLLHGALGAGKQLDPLEAKLRSLGFDPVIYEFSGHGKRTDFTGSFSIESLSEELLAWIRSEQLQPANIFGYSMGGYVALWLSSQHPQLVRQLVTLGTKFSWSPEESQKETRKLDPDFLLEKAPAYCDYMEALHGNAWRQVLEKTATLMTALGKKPLLDESGLKNIHVPVHLLLGELDKMVTRQETENVQSLIKDSQYQLLNGFVHPLERIDQAELGTVLAGIFTASAR